MMARMVRKQIVIDTERDALLERMAAARGSSQSEVVRLAIDTLAEQMRRADERERAHAELMEMFDRAPNLGLTDESGRRAWTRSDLYAR